MKNVRLFCCFIMIFLFSSISNITFCEESKDGVSKFLDSYVVNELNDGIIYSNLNTNNITKYDYSMVDSITIDFYDFYNNLDNLDDLYLLTNLRSLNIEFSEFSLNYNKELNLDKSVLDKIDIDFNKFEKLNKITIDSPSLDYNFEFIKTAKNIKTLNIYALNSDNLEFLSSFSQLRNLSICNTNISNLDFLKNLTEIRSLVLQSNPSLNDISKLDDLINLHSLLFDDCSQLSSSDFSSLNLNKMYIFELSNMAGLNDINFVNNYNKLYTFRLHDITIDDLYFVEKNTTIRDFSIYNSYVNSYTSFMCLKKNNTILRTLLNEEFEPDENCSNYKNLSTLLANNFVFKNYKVYFKNSNTILLKNM